MQQKNLRAEYRQQAVNTEVGAGSLLSLYFIFMVLPVASCAVVVRVVVINGKAGAVGSRIKVGYSSGVQ